MFITRIIRSMLNLVFLVAALVTAGALAEMTYDMAVSAGNESKRGFIKTADLNKLLLSK